MNGPRPPWRLAVLTCLLLGLSTPPFGEGFTAVLVLPALAGLLCLAHAERRPLLCSYLVGAVHIGWFSFSLRHVLLPGWFAIAAVGGLYYLFAAWLLRRLRALPAPLALAIAVAAMNWLRAAMPEIPYPHGQPCHALWRTPGLLQGVALGGEPLLNGLLGALAGAMVELGSAWRVAVPAMRVARRRAAVVLVLAIAVTLLPAWLAPVSGDGRTCHVALVEPGFAFGLVPRDQAWPLWRERLWQPTAELGRDASLDLILWPESSHPGEVRDGVWDSRRLELPPLGPRTRLCVGAMSRHDRGQTPTAVLLDARGEFCGSNDKRVLVPAGEYIPLQSLLPEALARALQDRVEAIMGEAPNWVPGAPNTPLQLADGTRFGALICYDNAFAAPADELVERGARLLCVLSNEAWYRGGGELQQLAAQTVIRAIETRTPVVRCTADGLSLAIGPDGAVLGELPAAADARDAARVLQVFVPLGGGVLPPMAWLRSALPWLLGAFVLAIVLHALLGWARLWSVRHPPARGYERSSRQEPPQTGS